jgi:hypothetical protein
LKYGYDKNLYGGSILLWKLQQTKPDILLL